MDIIFKCEHCQQELSVEATGAGTEIQCPACAENIVIPEATEEGLAPHIINPIASSAAAREGPKHFTVKQREGPSESLISKPLKPLEVTAHEGVQLMVKCIRHADCVEVGKDHFDETVTNFLNKIGETSIIKVETFNYAHRDLETRAFVTDYGVFIMYKG